MFPIAAFLVRINEPEVILRRADFYPQAVRSQSLEPYLAFKGADLAFWRHLSPFQEAVHPSYPEYERRHPNVIPPFFVLLLGHQHLGSAISLPCDNDIRLFHQPDDAPDAEVTAYPHERKQPYIN